MPRYFFYEETVREWSEEGDAALSEIPEEFKDYGRTPGGKLTQYEPAQARFEPASLEGEEARLHGILRRRGVAVVVVGYDGGGDEGWAHFEQALVAGGPGAQEALSKDDLVSELHGGPLGDEIATPHVYYARSYKPTRQERARDALDGYAYLLAARVLGAGFGNGDCEILGRLRVDITSGLIVDEDRPDDPPPHGDEPYEHEEE